MASLITHVVVGASIALPFCRDSGFRKILRPAAVVISAIVMANLPDADLLYWGRVDYADFFGHRGIWHSPFFIVLLSLAMAGALTALVRGVTLRAFLLLSGIWIAAGVSHAVLDALTDGGLGVMMFYPFSEQRFFFGWRPLRVSPIGFASFVERAAPVIASELPLCVTSIVLGWIGYRFNNNRAAS